MKILYFTDTHIRGTTPQNRKDNLVETLEKKFNEVIGIINGENIDYVIHGGDLFDRPDVSVSIVSKFAEILNKIKVPIYIVSGNHDIYGHNPETLGKTMLGLLNAINILHVIDSGEKIILEKNGIKVQLTGQPYIYNLDDPINRDKYIIKSKPDNVQYLIHVVHGMLLDRPFIKGIPYTLIDDIKETKADITLCGHYHSGFGIKIIDGKYFINPGSLIRITNSVKEIERIPQVVIMDLSKKIDIKLVPLKTAQKGELILDRKEIENYMYKNERLNEFKQSIDETVNFDKLDINKILSEISHTEGIKPQVKEEALRRIASSQIKFSGDDI